MHATRSGALAAALVVGSAGLVWWSARADEMSASDKLRLLYSTRFSFTHDGDPLVTVELMSGQRAVRLSSPRGVMVLPDGEGGARVDGGADWTVTAEGAQPAVIEEWTVVARLAVDDDDGARAALALWQSRGFGPRRFEIGTVFGVDGEVIDSREALIGVAPVRAPGGAQRAGELAR